MFVRFRQTTRRLRASLTETHRAGGKVRHEHVAGLGSVPLLPTAADRIAFWTKLHQRLDTLGNRIDAAQRAATYLADVLDRMVSGRTKVNTLRELLPWNWRAARGADASGLAAAA
jgi:hypothetical protein